MAHGGIAGAGDDRPILAGDACDFVNYDDDIYVTENPHVQGGLTWDTVKWAFCNPVHVAIGIR